VPSIFFAARPHLAELLEDLLLILWGDGRETWIGSESGDVGREA